MPSQREILEEEQILEHKFITNNLNIVKCNLCLPLKDNILIWQNILYRVLDMSTQYN
jgi:hypothetical protein